MGGSPGRGLDEAPTPADSPQFRVGPMSSSSPATVRIPGGSLQLEDKHAHSFPLRSSLITCCPKNCWKLTCNHKTRAGKDRVGNRKTPKAKKGTLVPSLSPEAGMLCQTNCRTLQFCKPRNSLFFVLRPVWIRFSATWNTEGVWARFSVSGLYALCAWIKRWVLRTELLAINAISNSSLYTECSAPAGSFLHPLRFIQPQWCGHHTPFSLSVPGHTGQRISILLSGPTLAHMWGPFPEMTFLLCLPLLQMTEGCFIFILFKFSRCFSVPLMPFFRSVSFLKDLLYQGTSHLFSLSGFCFYLSEEN